MREPLITLHLQVTLSNIEKRTFTFRALQGQAEEHIFLPNGGHCTYFLENGSASLPRHFQSRDAFGLTMSERKRLMDYKC